jgi:hypothetical protein
MRRAIAVTAVALFVFLISLAAAASGAVAHTVAAGETL